LRRASTPISRQPYAMSPGGVEVLTTRACPSPLPSRERGYRSLVSSPYSHVDYDLCSSPLQHGVGSMGSTVLSNDAGWVPQLRPASPLPLSGSRMPSLHDADGHAFPRLSSPGSEATTSFADRMWMLGLSSPQLREEEQPEPNEEHTEAPEEPEKEAFQEEARRGRGGEKKAKSRGRGRGVSLRAGSKGPLDTRHPRPRKVFSEAEDEAFEARRPRRVLEAEDEETVEAEELEETDERDLDEREESEEPTARELRRLPRGGFSGRFPGRDRDREERGAGFDDGPKPRSPWR